MKLFVWIGTKTLCHQKGKLARRLVDTDETLLFAVQLSSSSSVAAADI
jgi:hypothetical protein